MSKKTNYYWSATLEVAFIVFLFYSNLLMGMYNRSGEGQTKGLFWAITQVVTIPNFIVAIISATIGHFFFDYMRSYSIKNRNNLTKKHHPKPSVKENVTESEETENN